MKYPFFQNGKNSCHKMVELRINKWLKNTTDILDISCLGLKEWPEALKGKEHLIVTLNCSFNRLTSLPSLPNCVKLICSHNRLATLTPSGSATLTPSGSATLTPSVSTSLTALPNCVKLDCSFNRLTSLPSLPNCVELHCYNNRLASLP